MPLQLYKPTAKNTGCGCSFSFNSKDQSFYISFIKQVSYNQNTQKGSFKGGETQTFKFNTFELGGFIKAIEYNQELSYFHKSPTGTVSINFKPYMVGEIQKGFGLTVFKTFTNGEKTSFRIGLTLDETFTFREYLKFVLDHFFSAIYSADKKAFEEKSKTKTATKPPVKEIETEQTETTENDSDIWGSKEEGPPSEEEEW